MSNVDYQIQILEAVRTKRVVECRRRKPGSLANPWVKVKHELLNFDKLEYRIAPITQAVWLVYDTVAKVYVYTPYGSPASAAFKCNSDNVTARTNRYVPVKMVPDES